MYRILSGAAALALGAGAAMAQQAGGPAYPDNWNGGPPLPPIGGGAYYAQPHAGYVQPRAQVVQPGYVQPGYVTPGYVQPGYVQPGYVAPGYVQPGYVAPRGYVYQTQRRVVTYQVAVPAVAGPPQSRCVVAILNGTAYGDAGCIGVTINPADIPSLRQKFSAYRPNSGYALNLPSDDDYR